MMKRILPLLSFVLALSLTTNAQLEGNSLHFDGTDDYITAALAPTFSALATNDFTLELWVKPESAAFSRVVFAQEDADNFISLSISPTSEVIFYIMVNGVNMSVQSIEMLTIGEWSHVALTWESSISDRIIYINGKQAPLETGLFSSSISNDNSMSFGSKADGSQVFNGELDEISIWNIAKSECEIAQDRSSKFVGNETNLIAHYNFDNGTPGGNNAGIDDLSDETSAANDGTLVNFALSGSTSNWVLSTVDLFKFSGDQSPITLTGDTLSGAQVHSDFFFWINCSDNSPIAGASNSTFNPILEDPNYNNTPTSYAMVSLSGPCTDTTECFLYDLISVDELAESELVIYPNPSNGIFTVQLPADTEEIQVLSLNGQVIRHFESNGTSAMNFNLSHLNGIYIVRLKTQSTIISSKISIQNN